MLLLPIFLGAFLGRQAAQLVQVGPFVDAFLWLFALPLGLAATMQWLAARNRRAEAIAKALGVLPVPATAIVLLIVIVAVLPHLGKASQAAAAVPFFVVFAIAAPALGWWIARAFGLEATAGRAIAFSMGTRNSLVVLPLALGVPDAMPVLPAVIVSQTLVELLSELVYMRVLPRLTNEAK